MPLALELVLGVGLIFIQRSPCLIVPEAVRTFQAHLARAAFRARRRRCAGVMPAAAFLPPRLVSWRQARFADTVFSFGPVFFDAFRAIAWFLQNTLRRPIVD